MNISLLNSKLSDHSHKRIIIFDKEGQLCNRFWSYLAPILWAIKNNKKIYVLFWDSQIKYFHRLRHNPYIFFPLNNYLWTIKIGNKYPWRNIINRIFYSSQFYHFVESEKGKRMGFIKGWGSCLPEFMRPLWDNKALMEQVHQIFKPNNDITQTVSQNFSKHFNTASEVIIGVHIRRGDYKDWLGGKYYYSNKVYMQQMHHLQELFSPKQVRFFCATNEPLPTDIIEEFRPLLIPDATAAHDLYGLALCDYLIGPPSTFSQWASFYGRVPLYLIEEPNKFPNKDDFSCVYALDHFLNGYIYNT